MTNKAKACIALLLSLVLPLGLTGCSDKTESKQPVSAQEAMDALEGSLKFTEDETGSRQFTFTVPDFENAADFGIRICGNDSAGTQVSCFGENNESWKAKESYSFQPDNWISVSDLKFTAELEGAEPLELDVLKLYRETYAETLYEKFGLTVAIPNEYIDQLLIITNPDSDANLISVYEKRSYEDAHGGYIFSIVRYTKAQYEGFLTSDGSGKSFFAKDDSYYYGWFRATDVQFYFTGSLDTESDEWKSWVELGEKCAEIRGDFIERNNLTPYNDNEFHNKDFTYDSKHLYLTYYPYYAYQDTAAQQGFHWQDKAYTLVLSQPAAQGESGIWCVERWYDNDYGNLYYEFPYETEMCAADYYAQLQSAADNGDGLFRLDPVQVGLEYVCKRLNHTLATEDSFRQVEGEPAGNILRRCNQVFDDMGTLQAATLASPGVEYTEREALEVPEYLAPLRNHIGMGDIIWLKAQEPSSLSGGVVYCRNADRTKTLSFYQQDNLLCVNIDGTEQWFKPAYNSTPYNKMFGLYEEFYRYYNPEPAHSYSNEEIHAAMDAVRAFKTVFSIAYDPIASYQAAQEYLQSEKGGATGATIDNIIVFDVTLTEDETPSNPSSAYGNCILIRDDAGSPWVVDDYGY